MFYGKRIPSSWLQNGEIPYTSCRSSRRAYVWKGRCMISNAHLKHAPSALALSAITPRCICPARPPQPQLHAQQDTVIGSVACRQKKRTLSCVLHAIPHLYHSLPSQEMRSGWPCMLSRSAPAGFYWPLSKMLRRLTWTGK